MAAAPVNVPQQTPAITQIATPTNPGNTAATQIGSGSPSNPAAGVGAGAGAPTGAHSVWTQLVFAFIGTGTLAVIANMNERIGRVLLSIMIGFLFMWLLLHSGSIAGWVNKAVPQTAPGKGTLA